MTTATHDPRTEADAWCTPTPKRAMGGGLRSVGTALDVLECFAVDSALGVSDVASRLGVAVLAQADDLLVRPDLDGVSIGREGGLAVSAVERPAETVASDVEMLAVERKTWDEAKRGDVRESLRRLFEAVVEQPLSLRGPARLAYARTLIANGYDPEGLTVLDAIAADDPVLGAQREIAILRGAAMARLGRTAETRKILSTKALARDPEAALWRGLAEVTAGLWLDAEGLLRAGSPILDRYPDDLQVVLRTAAAASRLAPRASRRLSSVRVPGVTTRTMSRRTTALEPRFLASAGSSICSAMATRKPLRISVSR